MLLHSQFRNVSLHKISSKGAMAAQADLVKYCKTSSFKKIKIKNICCSCFSISFSQIKSDDSKGLYICDVQEFPSLNGVTGAGNLIPREPTLRRVEARNTATSVVTPAAATTRRLFCIRSSIFFLSEYSQKNIPSKHKWCHFHLK